MTETTKNHRLATLGVAILVLGALFAAPAAANDDGSVAYIFHGIDGMDLGLEADLPVDVLVNGAICAAAELTFGEFVGPFFLDPGDYNIQISLANPGFPCTSNTVIGAVVPLAANETVAIAAHLDAAGGPTASKFPIDVSRTPDGQGRLIAHHTAAAPTVDVIVDPAGAAAGPIEVPNVSNGQQLSADLKAGKVQVSLTPAGSDTVVFGPVDVNVKPFRAVLAFAVASLDNGTFTILTAEVPTGLSGNGTGGGNGGGQERDDEDEDDDDDEKEDDDDRRGRDRDGRRVR
jgi:hypothetical protein